MCKKVIIDIKATGSYKEAAGLEWSSADRSTVIHGLKRFLRNESVGTPKAYSSFFVRASDELCFVNVYLHDPATGQLHTDEVDGAKVKQLFAEIFEKVSAKTLTGVTLYVPEELTKSTHGALTSHLDIMGDEADRRGVRPLLVLAK